MTTPPADQQATDALTPTNPRVGSSRTAPARPSTLTTIQRLRDPLPNDSLRSWVLTLVITVVAFVIRVVNIGYPNYLVFDETYYAKDAWALLKYGYEVNWPDAAAANASVAAGNPDIMLNSAEFVVHPQLGKWLIAAGEAMFGMNSFGWRISACVFGALLVAVTIRLARRVSRSTMVGAIAGILLTVDGLAFTMSRIALLDIFQAFFVLAGVAALVADRDYNRTKIADMLEQDGAPDLGGRYGRVVAWRPWRWVAGLMFGLSCGVKWNSLYVIAVFGLLSVIWDVRARRLAGAGFKSWWALLADGVLAFIAIVVTAAATYVATWASWFRTSGGWDRQWGETNPDDPLVQAVGPLWGSFIHDHQEIYNFHTGDFINHATHPYAANPWGWLLMIRPIGIDAVNDIQPGTDGCTATGSNCLRVISAMGTPLLWWLGAAALVVAVIWWIGGRDWRFGVPVLGVAATWLPWCFTSLKETRPLFFFYGIMIIPFTVIALAMVLGLIIGRARDKGRRRGAIVAGVVIGLIMLNFAYIYPVLTDALLPYNDWMKRMWLRSWI